VEEMSSGRVILAAGTLYGVLSKLLSYKLISLVGEDQDNPRRKIYNISDDGTELLDYEISRLNEMLEKGSKKIADYTSIL